MYLQGVPVFILFFHIDLHARLEPYCYLFIKNCDLLNQPPHKLFMVFRWYVGLFLQKGFHFLNALAFPITLGILHQYRLAFFPQAVNLIGHIGVVIFGIRQSQKFLL